MHSAINVVTPEQRHRGEDAARLTERKQVYLNAQSKKPDRWSGNIRNREQASVVYLNPEKPDTERDTEQYRAA
ncbi:MAG: hypothetical protein K0U68_06160 [Gammaproteobacteria bacterium]|nr:hypothetical protein [Gammaproteobacteria bacterium]